MDGKRGCSPFFILHASFCIRTTDTNKSGAASSREPPLTAAQRHPTPRPAAADLFSHDGTRIRKTDSGYSPRGIIAIHSRFPLDSDPGQGYNYRLIAHPTLFNYRRAPVSAYFLISSVSVDLSTRPLINTVAHCLRGDLTPSQPSTNTRGGLSRSHQNHTGTRIIHSEHCTLDLTWGKHIHQVKIPLDCNGLSGVGVQLHPGE